jgi:hypothetical protein
LAQTTDITLDLTSESLNGVVEGNKKGGVSASLVASRQCYFP